MIGCGSNWHLMFSLSQLRFQKKKRKKRGKNLLSPWVGFLFLVPGINKFFLLNNRCFCNSPAIGLVRRHLRERPDQAYFPNSFPTAPLPLMLPPSARVRVQRPHSSSQNSRLFPEDTETVGAQRSNTFQD